MRRELLLLMTAKESAKALYTAISSHEVHMRCLKSVDHGPWTTGESSQPLSMRQLLLLDSWPSVKTCGDQGGSSTSECAT